MRINRQIATTAAILAVVLAAAPAGVALAGAEPSAASQPDGRIRLTKLSRELFPTETYARPWLGDNVYNTTGYRQAAKESWYDSTPGWERWIFAVSIQNDGTSSDRFRVQATGTSLQGWSVKYFHGTTNITAAVAGGSFTTPSLGPGEEYLIKVKVKRAADEFGDFRRLVSMTSLNNANKTDVVKLVVKQVTCTC